MLTGSTDPKMFPFMPLNTYIHTLIETRSLKAGFLPIRKVIRVSTLTNTAKEKVHKSSNQYYDLFNLPYNYVGCVGI